MLNCPPDYAYGAKGIPGVIPPDSTLIFDVDLVAIKGKSVFAEEVVPHIQGEVVEQDKDDGTPKRKDEEITRPMKRAVWDGKRVDEAAPTQPMAQPAMA